MHHFDQMVEVAGTDGSIRYVPNLVSPSFTAQGVLTDVRTVGSIKQGADSRCNKRPYSNSSMNLKVASNLKVSLRSATAE